MGATCFPELCFTAVKYSSGNSMVIITQPTLIIHPPFDYVQEYALTFQGATFTFTLSPTNTINIEIDQGHSTLQSFFTGYTLY